MFGKLPEVHVFSAAKQVAWVPEVHVFSAAKQVAWVVGLG